MENWEEFNCPDCNTKYGVLTLQLLGDTKRILKGILRCSTDQAKLQWTPFEDEEGILDQEFESSDEAWEQALIEKFDVDKEAGQKREAAILQAHMEGLKPAKKVGFHLPESVTGEKFDVPSDARTAPLSGKEAKLDKRARKKAEKERKRKAKEEAKKKKKKTPKPPVSEKKDIKIKEIQPEEGKIEKLPPKAAADKAPIKIKAIAATLAATGAITAKSITSPDSSEETTFESFETVEVSTETTTTETFVTTSESEVITSSTDAIAEKPAVAEIPSKKLISPITEPIPFAEEFWQYYYTDKNIEDPNTYLGDNDATKKIEGLLGEINTHVLNHEIIDISLPVIEELQPNGKVFFIGDSHGSITDTDLCIRFFIKEIEKAEKKKQDILIIFDGDFVDRNPMDIHNLFYIFAFTIKYAQYVRLVRGNHEEYTINSNYGFRKNVNNHFGGEGIFGKISTTFANLPMMHVVKTATKSILTLHGGIPIYDVDPNEMPDIPDFVGGDDFLDSRFENIDEMDELSQQIIWNDPTTDLPPGVFYLPSRRGIGFNFGQEVFDKWMKVNQVDRLVRGHEVFLEGHREFFDNRLFSIFSSSDYSGRKIDAQILEFDFSKDWDKNWKHYSIRKDLK